MIWIKGKGNFSNFAIPCTPAEVTLATRLYNHMVSKEKLDLGVLMQLLHTFLVTLVWCKIAGVDVIACPSDVSLIFYCLLRRIISSLPTALPLHAPYCNITGCNFYARSLSEASCKLIFFPHNLKNFKKAPFNDTLSKWIIISTAVSSQVEKNIVTKGELEGEVNADIWI